jgi:hypothetical protein
MSALVAEIESLLAALRRGKSINVNDQQRKDSALSLSKRYFDEVRPSIVSRSGETKELLGHDEQWQRLVRLAHGNNARRTYVRTLSMLRKQATEFQVAALVNVSRVGSAQRAGNQDTVEEARLLETLERLVPSAATSYRQGMLDLRAPARLSYRGTASEFRESLREVLDHLAPDDSVIGQKGFKLEEKQSRPTMKQKVAFILSSRGAGKTQRSAAEKSARFIDELSGEVTRAVYDRASLATHVQQSKKEVEQIKRYVDTVLFDILEISVE